MPEYTTAQRLQEIMLKRNLKQVDIIRLAGPYCKKYRVNLGRNDLSQYISGKVLPRQNKLYILGLALNVSEAWLMGYDVPIERINTATDITESLTNEEKQLMHKFRILNSSGKEKAAEYISDLLENPKYTATENKINTHIELVADSTECTILYANTNEAEIID